MDPASKSDNQQPSITEKPDHEEQDENLPKDPAPAQEDAQPGDDEGKQVKHSYENNPGAQD